MKTWAPVLVLLAGCATGCATSPNQHGAAEVDAGTLTATWLQPREIEILVDGKPHNGTWSSRACHTDSCRGIYRNVSKHHRRYITRGQAVLTSGNGGRLECQWVSHLPDLAGSCHSADGRVFRLTGG